MFMRVAFVSGVLIGCGIVWHRWQRQQEFERLRREHEERENARRLAECLVGVWSEPRPLIPDIAGSLRGPGETVSTTESGRPVELPLTPQAQRDAWSAVTFLAREGRTEDRERTVQLVLEESVAAACDWSRGWAPYQQYPKFRQVYEAVGTLLDLAELSLKYSPRADTDENPRGAMISPGWVHQRPTPTQDIRPGDYVEVLIDRYSADPSADTSQAEWAWVHVESAPEGKGTVGGTISQKPPPGQSPYLLRNSDEHGFEHGTRLLVPRTSVYRVFKGA